MGSGSGNRVKGSVCSGSFCPLPQPCAHLAWVPLWALGGSRGGPCLVLGGLLQPAPHQLVLITSPPGVETLTSRPPCQPVWEVELP